MKNRLALILICGLLIFTGIAAAFHMTTRTQADGLVLECRGQKTVVKPISFTLTNVRGEIVNGLGETRSIDAKGFSLSALIGEEAFESITVVASDEYRATLLPEDVPDASFIFTDGRLNLVVFGDPDSKRCVTDVARVILQ